MEWNHLKVHLSCSLREQEYGQYGEYRCKDFDELLDAGYAEMLPRGEYQSGFIAQDWTGTKGDDFCAVCLTELGRAQLEEILKDKEKIEEMREEYSKDIRRAVGEDFAADAYRERNR